MRNTRAKSSIIHEVSGENIMTNYNFCSQCGKESIRFVIPSGDTLPRHVCDSCQTIFYENPKIVVGTVTTYQDKFLLCKRAIEPQKGFWTYPAGYLENKESLEEGAHREANEEAGITIKLSRLIGTYSLTGINQIHIIYAAEMLTPDYSPGEESLEVALFSQEEIPWNELAFPVIHWALTAYIQNKNGSVDSKVSNDVRGQVS
jgi:ADP-ribose pyrophosphatase YjhB (NUDIX family)